MGFPQTVEQALEKAHEIRIRALEYVNTEQRQAADIREEQVKLSQEERSKINFLAFAIIGSVLSFSPDSLQSPYVVFGLGMILLNSFVFGFLADYFQRNLNISNAEQGLLDIRATAKPYFDSYDEFIKYLDDPAVTEKGIQEKYDEMQNAYTTYLEEHKKKNAKPRLAKRTKLSIGHWYFVLFASGLLIMAIGLIKEYGFENNTAKLHIQVISAKIVVDDPGFEPGTFRM